MYQGSKKLIRKVAPPILIDFAKHFYNPKPSLQPRQRELDELKRLSLLPKGTSERARMPIADFQITDPQSFVEVYRDYFFRRKFEFKAQTNSPKIIDCGANVGVSVLYWKSLYPESRVIAFEPDPQAFLALESNCRGFSGIDLRNSAVWIAEGRLRFAAVGSDGGHLSHLTQRECPVPELEVSAERLKEFLREPVDMLKIDIEGAEVEVLEDCRDVLKNVRQMFVEFHSFERHPQKLGSFFSIIENAGFRIHIHTDMPSSLPFLNLEVYNEKDLRLNCFCNRIDFKNT
jgi:FkbM family methyltransferase